jgi:hypothetical protein
VFQHREHTHRAHVQVRDGSVNPGQGSPESFLPFISTKYRDTARQGVERSRLPCWATGM